VAPSLVREQPKGDVDLETLRAVLVNRMHVLRDYARDVTVPVVRGQLSNLQGKAVRSARRLLVREPLLLDNEAQRSLSELLAASPALKTVYEFRERLNVLWSGTHTSNETLLQHFRKWITDAEESGIAVLQNYARAMRGVRAIAS
jgi:stearoyl-CoA desaturase (delta-9 desaturase)